MDLVKSVLKATNEDTIYEYVKKIIKDEVAALKKALKSSKYIKEESEGLKMDGINDLFQMEIV